MNALPDEVFFLDTNLWVYSFDSTEPKKREQSSALIVHALTTGKGVVSTQVIQEFLNVATAKFAKPMSAGEAIEFVQTVFAPLCRHSPSPDFYTKALRLREKMKSSFYDALIVAAALESGCRLFFSEDFQHGRVIEGMRIINPFY